jgi:hypothetical protein
LAFLVVNVRKDTADNVKEIYIHTASEGCNHDDKDDCMVKSRECPDWDERGLQSEAALKHGCVHWRSDGAFTMDDVVTMPIICYKDSMTSRGDVSKITGKLAMLFFATSMQPHASQLVTGPRPVTCPEDWVIDHVR